MWLTGLVAPWHVGSSQTRARTRVPRIGRQILNHCATREAPLVAFDNELLKVNSFSTLFIGKHLQSHLTDSSFRDRILGWKNYPQYFKPYLHCLLASNMMFDFSYKNSYFSSLKIMLFSLITMFDIQKL